MPLSIWPAAWASRQPITTATSAFETPWMESLACDALVVDTLPSVPGDGRHVLVSAAGNRHDDDLILPHRRHKRARVGDRMRAFDCRNNALGARQILERIDRLVVGDGHIARSSRIVQRRMLGKRTGASQSSEKQETVVAAPSDEDLIRADIESIVGTSASLERAASLTESIHALAASLRS